MFIRISFKGVFMLSFLKKFKRVKKAKSIHEKEDCVYPKHNLFWAEKEQKVSEDGVDFSYKHKDCFWGTSDEEVLNASGVYDTFGVKRITGERSGLCSIVFNCDFVVKIPLSQELYEEYVMDIDDDFSVDGKTSNYYSESDIRKYADSKNAQARAAAKEKAMSEAKTRM